MNRAMTPKRDLKKHYLVTAAALLGVCIFIGILYVGLKQDQTKIPSTLIGKQAPAFRVNWIQGKRELPKAADQAFRLAHFVGHPIVLNFWASWCVSCRQEAKELEEFWQKYRDQGVYVVGIAIQDTQEAAKKFADYYGKTYILGLDTDGKASIDYGVTGVPETFMINGKGQIVHKEVGPVSVEILEEHLKKML